MNNLQLNLLGEILYYFNTTHKIFTNYFSFLIILF